MINAGMMGCAALARPLLPRCVTINKPPAVAITCYYRPPSAALAGSGSLMTLVTPANNPPPPPPPSL